ncbi:MAG: metallophosphoesterase [Hyphomicrobiaceae bacterium]|nr:metallophosphoesterase [Hyphomicrobiaceae bacterium]
MASLLSRLRRIPSRLLVDPLEGVWPKVVGFPRVDEGIPAGLRLYVIGDIHGRIDLLSQTRAKIKADRAASGSSANCKLVYLGDYIDGGPSSREVIDAMIDDEPDDVEKITLIGNHERLLLDFLNDARTGQKWLSVHGRTTLESYGVPVPKDQLNDSQFTTLQSALRDNLPKRHVDFIRSLRPYYICGDYAFVHAGIRPGLPISDQSLEDLLTIRSEFTSSGSKHEKIIVHGHTYSRLPRVRAYRIGIDTGSYMTGKLTCLVLERDIYRFL